MTIKRILEICSTSLASAFYAFADPWGVARRISKGLPNGRPSPQQRHNGVQFFRSAENQKPDVAYQCGSKTKIGTRVRDGEFGSEVL